VLESAQLINICCCPVKRWFASRVVSLIFRAAGCPPNVFGPVLARILHFARAVACLTRSPGFGAVAADLAIQLAARAATILTAADRRNVATRKRAVHGWGTCGRGGLDGGFRGAVGANGRAGQGRGGALVMAGGFAENGAWLAGGAGHVVWTKGDATTTTSTGSTGRRIVVLLAVGDWRLG